MAEQTRMLLEEGRVSQTMLLSALEQAERGVSFQLDLLLRIGAEANRGSSIKAKNAGLAYDASFAHLKRTPINLILDDQLTTPLIWAASRGQLRILNTLLEGKADICLRDKAGHSALMKAAVKDRLEVCKRLLEVGAEALLPDAVDEGGNSALLLASKSGHTTIVELLLARKAAVQQRNSEGKSALALACGGCFVDAVALLLAHKAAVDDADAKGTTSLMLAVEAGRPGTRVVELLLEHKAEVNRKDAESRTALLRLDFGQLCMQEEAEAARAGKMEAAVGQIPKANSNSIAKKTKSKKQEKKESSTLQLLLKAKAETSSTDQQGNTTLMRACAAGHRTSVYELLKQTSVQVNQRNNRSWSALHFACLGGHEQLTALLFDRELLQPEFTDILAETDDLETPLALAARGMHPAMVKALIAHGTNVNARAAVPLHENPATYPLAKRPRMLLLLLQQIPAVLEKKAEQAMIQRTLKHKELFKRFNIVDHEQERLQPSLEAQSKVRERLISVVREMVAGGATVDDEEDLANVEQTALHIAVEKGVHELVPLLIQAKASVNRQSLLSSTEGKVTATPLWIAIHLGNLDVVKALLASKASVSGHQGKLVHAYTPAAPLVAHNSILSKKLSPKETAAAVEAANANAMSYAFIQDPIESEGARAVSSYSRPLLVAAERGEAAIVEILIQFKANIAATENNGTTSLLLSAENGHTNVVNVLIKNGADLNARNLLVEGAIVKAGDNNHLQCVVSLLENKSDPELADVNGETPLVRLARSSEKLPLVQALLRYKAEVDVPGKQGQVGAALFNAAERGDHEMTRSLIAAHASVRHKDKVFRTPLERCILAPAAHPKVITALLEAGANPVRRDLKGSSSLSLALVQGDSHVKVTRLLMAAKADPHARERALNWDTPLIHAARHGNVAVARLLLEAKVDVNLRDGHTPKPQHDDQGNRKKARDEYYIDESEVVPRGRSALVLAVVANQAALVKVLLNANANYDERVFTIDWLDAEGRLSLLRTRLPMSSAVAHQQVREAATLLESGGPALVSLLGPEMQAALKETKVDIQKARRGENWIDKAAVAQSLLLKFRPLTSIECEQQINQLKATVESKGITLYELAATKDGTDKEATRKLLFDCLLQKHSKKRTMAQQQQEEVKAE